MILWLLACAPGEPEPAPARVEPTSIATAKSWVRTIDADATHVYWTSYDPTSGRSARAVLERAPLAGGPAEVVAIEAHPPQHLAVHGGFLYWSYEHGSLKRVPVTGGTPQLITRDSAPCFNVDDSGVYLIRGVEVLHVDPETGEERQVAKKALAECPVPFGDYVFWPERTGLFRVPKSGGEPAMFAKLKKAEPLIPFEDALYTCYDDILTRVDPETGEHAPIRGLCKGPSLQVSANAHWITADHFEGWPPQKGTRLIEVTKDGPSYLFAGQGASPPKVIGDDVVWFGQPSEGPWTGFKAALP